MDRTTGPRWNTKTSLLKDVALEVIHIQKISKISDQHGLSYTVYNVIEKPNV